MPSYQVVDAPHETYARHQPRHTKRRRKKNGSQISNQKRVDKNNTVIRTPRADANSLGTPKGARNNTPILRWIRSKVMPPGGHGTGGTSNK